MLQEWLGALHAAGDPDRSTDLPGNTQETHRDQESLNQERAIQTICNSIKEGDSVKKYNKAIVRDPEVPHPLPRWFLQNRKQGNNSA